MLRERTFQLTLQAYQMLKHNLFMQANVAELVQFRIHLIENMFRFLGHYDFQKIDRADFRSGQLIMRKP